MLTYRVNCFADGPRLTRFKEIVGDKIGLCLDFGPTRTLDAGKARISVLLVASGERREATIDTETLREQAQSIVGADGIETYGDALIDAAIPYLVD